jgi:hypothetical protein
MGSVDPTDELPAAASSDLQNVHPRPAGHGPTLFAGLSKYVDLKLVSRLEFGSGALAMRYEPRRQPSLARVELR